MDQTINSSKESRRTPSDDPQYFGGYLNMARHNIFSINNHIAKKFGLNELDEDGKVPGSFLGNKDQNIKTPNGKRPLNWKHVFVKTVHFMPVIKKFNPEYYPKGLNMNPEREWVNEMTETLKILFGELQDFRNDYTHYWSTEKGAERKTQVSPELAKFLAEAFELAIAYTKERMKDVLCETDYSLVSKMKMTEQDNRITTEGLVFLTSMFLTREQGFLFIGKVTGLKNTTYNTFLATHEVLMNFCVKLPHNKLQSEDNKKALTMDIINNLNRCPKPLYNVISDEAKKQFQPILTSDKARNLFDNSSNQPIDDLDYDEYLEFLTKRIRHKNRFSYFALRFIDENELFAKWRFQVDLGKIELANYTKIFDRNEEERRVIENAKAFDRLSNLLNEETVLAKMHAADTTYFEQFAPHYNMDNNKIGLSSKTCCAVFSNNPNGESKVKRNLRQPLPEAFLSTHELSKIVLLEYLEKGASEKLIDNFISTSREQLLTKDFIEGIKQQLPDWNNLQRYSQPVKKPQEPLTKKVTEAKERDLNELLDRKETLNLVLQAYNLDHKQIPTRILDYWLNISEVKDHIAFSDRIKQMKLDCKNRLKALAKHRLDPEVRIPKIGEMATFLAKDIVAMLIDENKKKKVTSFYYDKMQQSIALFADPEMKASFLSIVSELELNSETVHPFLRKLNFQKIHKTSQLYEAYLEEKGKKEITIDVYNRRLYKKTPKKKDVSWIETTFYHQEWNDDIRRNMTVVKMPENRSQVPYTIRKWEEKLSQTPDWRVWLRHVSPENAQKDRAKPIDLPTNLFDVKLTELLRKQLEEKAIPFKADDNLNQLMKHWWQRIREDDTQAFYQSDREYCIYEQTVRFKPNQSDKFADYYSEALKVAIAEMKTKREMQNKEPRAGKKSLPPIDPKEVERVFKRSIAGTEKAIRILQEEDRVALLMAEQLMGASQEPVKLSKIDVLYDETITDKRTISGYLSFDAQGREVPRKSQRQEIKREITFEGKRKNRSLLDRYIFDRRLPELFEYFPEQEIPLTKLKEELKAYEKARQEVFDRVFELEKQIITPEENRKAVEDLFIDQKGNKQNGNIQHNPYLLYLLAEKQITPEEEQFLRMVRNGFSHNQFPQKESMELIIHDWKEDIAIATQIMEEYNKIIERIIG